MSKKFFTFKCIPVTSRFCWLLTALSHAAPRLILRFIQTTTSGTSGTVQIILMPTVSGKLCLWSELHGLEKAGIVDYSAKDEVVAVEVQIKQIAGIIASNCDGFQKILEFVFSGNTLTIKVISQRNTTKLSTTNVVEDESMLDELDMMMDLHHPQPPTNNEFTTEYAMPIEWIHANEHLIEPSVPKPEHYIKPPSNLRELLSQLNYLKNFDIEPNEKKGNKGDTSKVYGEVRIVDRNDLEVTTWATDTSHAHICHRDLGISQNGMTLTNNDVDQQKSDSARCMVLIDPLIKSIQCLQSILEASMLSMGAQAVFAVVPDTAIVVFVQLQGEAGVVTMYLPAYLI